MPNAARTCPRVTDPQFLRDVLRGLRRTGKRIPCKYFYDEAGSQLFDRICELPEYYPTRSELEIMRADAPAMAGALGPDVVLIEYGSGSSVKTRLLLDQLHRPAAYVPVDISREHLLRTAERLAEDYGRLAVRPVVADFTRPFALPSGLPAGRRVVYFPGSTIGNFSPSAAVRLLRGMADLVGRGGAVLLGVDLKKDPAVLHAAYNDASGVTAAFNLNLLARINRELGANFRPAGFFHHALYNPRPGRIEMHVVSRLDQVVHVGGAAVPFAEGESILTEYSYKYTVREARDLAVRAGLRPAGVWFDAARRFSVHLLNVG